LKSRNWLSVYFRETAEEVFLLGVAQTDRALYAIVSGAAPSTIDDVVGVMQGIDQALNDTDGLKWFNRLYMMVTQEVDRNPPAGGWKDPAWLVKLDVVFADLYFKAVAECLDGSTDAPNAWEALMEARFRPGIDRIQFALAGMNAHINHDLALALIETDKQMNVVPECDSPQHVDYEAVNGLLEKVMPAELQMLATDVLGQAAQDTGKIGRLLAFWNVCKARELAWDFADHLRGLSAVTRPVAMGAQDQVTGALGRAILVCA
jgi:hypothetical protein